MKKLSGSLHIHYVKEKTVFNFDLTNIAQCNMFISPDGRQQQHLGEEGGGADDSTFWYG